MVVSHRQAARKLAAAIRTQSPVMVYAHDVWAASATLASRYGYIQGRVDVYGRAS
jgi:predicted nucleic acid-binding protein